MSLKTAIKEVREVSESQQIDWDKLIKEEKQVQARNDLQMFILNRVFHEDCAYQIMSEIDSYVEKLSEL